MAKPNMSRLTERIASLSPEQRARLDRLLKEKKAQPSGGIVPRQNPATAPLSYGQQRLWVLHRMDPDSSLYNVFKGYLLRGPLVLLDLERAMAAIFGRHEVLRTTFAEADGEPVQRIHPPGGFRLPVVDLGGLAEPLRERESARLIGTEGHLPFDLERAFPLRLRLLRLASERHALLYTIHHMVSDAVTTGIFMTELGTLYRGLGEALPKLEIQYGDYAAWQRQRLAGKVLETQAAYWKRQLAGAPPLLDLPLDRPRPRQQRFEGDAVFGTLDSELAARLRALAAERNVTLFTALLAGFQAFLYRYCGQNDLVLGIASANRNQPGTEKLMGYFANSLALRARFPAGLSFQDHLRRTRETVLDAHDHQDLPFEMLVEMLQPQRDMSHTPLFQAVFVLQKAEQSGSKIGPAFPGLDIAPLAFKSRQTRYDLLLLMTDSGSALPFNFEFNTAILDRATVEEMRRAFQDFLSQAVSEPARNLSSIPLWHPDKARTLLAPPEPAPEIRAADLVHRRVGANAAARPEAPALVFEDKTTSYRDLHDTAHRLAHYLRVGQGVKPNDVIAVLAERSDRLIVALLGILEAGPAYLPLDPAQPESRLLEILEDAEPKLLLTESSWLYELETEIPMFALDLQLRKLKEPDRPLAEVDDPANLAYMIYTSGSTGRPKGVLLEHGGLAQLARVQAGAFGIEPGTRVLQFASQTFDASVSEIFVTLAAGGTLFLADRETLMPGPELTAYCRRHRIEVATFPPAVLDVMNPDDFPDLRTVVSAGEKCSAHIVSQWARGRTFINAYGPTEVTVCATLTRCDPEAAEDPPIGKALDYVDSWVLDAARTPVPPGVPAELCLGGAALARGYHRRPELTAEKFVPHPYGRVPGERLFPTADLVRCDRDGNLSFQGRRDHQLKLRGFRVEPGEVEEACRRHPMVRDAAVIADSNGTGLIAYVVPERRFAPTVEGRRRYMQPNGMAVVHHNKGETDFIYGEVFGKRVYLAGGVKLQADDCIVDVGANIGMFSLFAQHTCGRARIFAFEPMPPSFELLRINTELYGPDVRVFPCALGEREGELSFTFYPNSTGASGRYADEDEEEAVVRALIHNQAAAAQVETRAAHENELVAGMFDTKTFRCPVKTLSQVIREQELTRIDLLKIDVEKSEMDVLLGIESHDWPKIRQIAIEVHDIDGRLDAMRRLLEEKGFQTETDQDALLAGTNLFNIIALREPKASWAPPELPVFEDGLFTTAALRSELKRRLPDYMVPQRFAVLESLPLNANGKLDREALPPPGPAVSESETDTGTAHSPTQELVAQIWEAVLQTGPLKPAHHFFEMGGHSLLATRVISRVREVFGVELPLRALFSHPTLAGFAAEIDERVRGGQGIAAPPIRPAARGGEIPLSFAQQRLWFLYRLEPENPFYNVAFTFNLEGSLRVDTLTRVANEMVRRHEILRTGFPLTDGTPVQSVKPFAPIRIAFEDFSTMEPDRMETAVRDWAREESRRTFDLSEPPLVRWSLAKCGDRAHVMALVLHHIVADGWSVGIIMREMAALYEAFLQDRPATLPDLPVQYADFALWQRQWLRGASLEALTDYWRGQLHGAPELLELPWDRPRPKVQTYAGGRVSRRLSPEMVESLHATGRCEGTTLFMTLLAGYAALLARYSGQADVCIGTGIANRNRSDVEGLIGFFVNTLVLRVKPRTRESFRDLLAQVRSVCLDAYAHEDMPFETLVDSLQPDRNLSFSPLFQAMFTLQHASEESLALTGLRLSPFAMAKETAKFDLTLALVESANGLAAVMEYNSDLFDRETVATMLGHYEHLLQAGLAHPDQALASLLLEGTDTGFRPLSERDTAEIQISREPVYRRFESRAHKYPDHVALRTMTRDRESGFGPGSVRLRPAATYADLDSRANRLARRLREWGVGPESLVGVCMPRVPELVVALLAVWKTGGAYVPLEPSHPQEHLAERIRDSEMGVLLTHGAVVDVLPSYELNFVNVFLMDEDGDSLSELSAEPLAANASGENLAYLLHTSGSTGRPKGVGVTHAGLANYLSWCARAYDLREQGLAAVHGSLGFDATVTSLWAPLLTGGSLVLIEQEPPVEALAALLASCPELSFLKLTPAHLDLLGPLLSRTDLSGLSASMVVGGDALHGESLVAWRSLPNLRIFNEYGPTEAVVGCSVHELGSGDSERGPVPIGTPVANAALHVLDPWMSPTPSGLAGELYIGGACLARGYKNRPRTTAASFLPNPFGSVPGARLYRSGDRVRYRVDQGLLFLGRCDGQLKLRGFRIEPGEIETRLKAHPAVQDAVLALRRDGEGEPSLVAYLVPDRSRATTVGRMLGFEREGRLPEEMRYELPNGLAIAHQNKSESDYLYQEIFAERFYLRHGIALPPDACIVDVGANIGMASLFFGLHAPEARIFAFEPIPDVHEKLRLNAALHGLVLVPVQAGLSDREGDAEFTFYPNVSVMSGRLGDVAVEREVVKATLLTKQRLESGKAEVTGTQLEELVTDRLRAETVTCPLRTLSSVIREHEIARIDLLKVDVEKSEADVLAGIDDADWPKIRQAVVEVHDIDGRLERIARLLRERGFQVVVEQDPILRETGIYNLYAKRPEPSLSAGTVHNAPAADPVWRSPAKLVRDVREDLKAGLPDYMVPARFMLMDALPLNANGKLDRDALPEPKGRASVAGPAYVPAETPVEEMIAAVWCETLELERVGAHDNFFDLGGNSLLLIKVHSRLLERIETPFSFIKLFEYPTVRSLAEYLGEPRSDEPESEPALQESRDRARSRREALSRAR